MSVKLRAIKAVIRAANRLRAKKNLKSLDPYQVQAKSEKGFTKTKFQTPKHITGGADDTSLRTATHYGPGGKEFKVAAHAKRAIWHDTRARGSESWRAEMSRVFGGEHMAQSGPGLKRSLSKLHKQIASDIKKFKKKKIKKVAEGGEIVFGKNVDKDLL